jgi:universal stress protein F
MKRILVGLDGSDHERVVLAQARALAAKLDARLILFRAVSLPISLPSESLAVSPVELDHLLVDGARRQLDALARELPEGLVERVQVEVGVPWRAICDAAKSDACDLVIVGSHGYGGIDRLIGTTAAKIVNHACCSVLIARTPIA